MSGICPSHASPIARAFTVSERSGALETLINRYKFEHVKGAVFPLAELFHESLPLLPGGIEIIPIPTVRSHIRERGYDHVELLVRQLAAKRAVPIKRALIRNNKVTQHTVRKTQRHMQAKTAFRFDSRYNIKGKTVLLVDDIVTTGATLQAAAKVLQAASATVWVATLAYQPLD